MDFICPSCTGTSFTLVSNVSGAQLANCSTCGTVTPVEIEARHGDTPVAAMSEPKTAAWRRAEDKFTKTRKKLDDDVKLYQQQRWDTETEKMARLRALRLARDANPPEAKKPAKRVATRKARPENAGKSAVPKETRTKHLGG